MNAAERLPPSCSESQEIKRQVQIAEVTVRNFKKKKSKTMADQIEELNAKIRELEEALEAEKKRKGPIREKIEAMSSEVVDSNPYR